MPNYFLLIFLVTLPFIGVGCQETSPPNKQAEHNTVLSFIKKNGTLKVKEGKKVCLLADDAINYEVFVSPNANMIAVETLLMSNLPIVRVYKKDVEGCFKPLKHALSTKLWHDFSKKEGFTIDNVSYPRMKFLKWVNNKKVQVELSGEVDNKVIDSNVSCDLQLFF